jgi:hypothetical protein
MARRHQAPTGLGPSGDDPSREESNATKIARSYDSDAEVRDALQFVLRATQAAKQT